MSHTFPAAANINNVAFPFSFSGFGTRPNNTASADWVSKGSAFVFEDNSGSVNFEMRFLRETTGTNANRTSNHTWTVANGQTHFAVTVSSAGVVKIYKNGAETTYRSGGTSGAGSLVSDAASDLVVHVDSVDHFGFWNIELSGAEITSLYNSGTGVNCYTVQSGNILVSTDTPVATRRRPLILLGVS